MKKISSSETTVFVYDGGGTLVAEYTARTTNDPAPAPRVSYLTQDHLGSPRVATDQNGAVIKRTDWMAFGEEVEFNKRPSGVGYDEVPETRKGYTGYEQDEESGLDFAQARYYNPKHGRYTSVDPLTASANVKNPQTFNRYSYVLNSPYKFTDALGLISSDTGACGNRCRNHDGSSGGGLASEWAPMSEWYCSSGCEISVSNGMNDSVGGATTPDPATSSPQGEPAVPPPAPREKQNDESGAAATGFNRSEAVEAVFTVGDIFMTEVGIGNQTLPSSVPAAANSLTNPGIQRRWSISAMMQLNDAEGNATGDYEYEISYGSNVNPDPDFNRVEGRKTVDGGGQAFLGSFIVARRSFGASVSGYDSRVDMPTNPVDGTAEVTIFRSDGATATIRFTVGVTNAKPTITPESIKLDWRMKK